MVSLQQFDREGLIHAVSSEQLMLSCVCYLSSVKHSEVQLSLMNLSSAADVTLGLPFLWWFSWESVSSWNLMVFASAIEEMFKVLEIFQIDCPSCLKVMMDCHLFLLIWAVLGLGLFPNRAIFCIPPLPCHNTKDWLKRIEKENKFHKWPFNKAHLLI